MTDAAGVIGADPLRGRGRSLRRPACRPQGKWPRRGSGRVGAQTRHRVSAGIIASITDSTPGIVAALAAALTAGDAPHNDHPPPVQSRRPLL